MWAMQFFHQALFIQLYVSYLGDLGPEKKEILFLLASLKAQRKHGSRCMGDIIV